MGGSGRGASGSQHRLRDLRAGPVARVRAAWAPGWPRTLLVRRCAAAALAVLAGVLALRGDPGSDPVDVVVAARDLPPGADVTAADVTVVRRESHSVPRGALTSPGEAVGAALAAPVRRGEALTDVRLLGAPLARAAAGVEDARVVTVRPADPALAEVVRAGDLVDIIAAPIDADSASVPDPAAQTPPAQAPAAPAPDPAATAPRYTLATAAPVVLVPPVADARSSRGRIVLVALPAREAARVASASMTRAMTVILH